MKIEIPDSPQPVSFHLVHPASCFILKGPGSKEGGKLARDVWMKVKAPAPTSQAVNLWSGDLVGLSPDTKVYPISLKVVEA